LFFTSYAVTFVINITIFCSSYQAIFGTGSVAAMLELFVSWPLWIANNSLKLKLILLSVDWLICIHLCMRFNLWI